MALSVARQTPLPLRFLTCNYLQRSSRVCISDYERHLIGNRDIVGYGFNGQPCYVDRPDFPFPAIRWKETNCEIEALRLKEQGDWNELTCEDKKALYRASFCQTFSEFKASNLGEWKSVTAGVLFLLCVPLWLYYYFKLTIYADMMPDSFKEENRAAQFRRLLDLRVNPIRGLASKWDYVKDDWKNPNDSWRTKPKE